MPSTVPPATTPARSSSRYLCDGDVLHAGVITLLVMLLSLGLVWLGYFVRVWRIAAHSPLVPPRRMTVLVFGRRLEGEAPGPEYCLRLARALQLLRNRQADTIWLLGGTDAGGPSEAEAGFAWLERQGLPANAEIQLEKTSLDSLENLRHARCLLRQQIGVEALPPVALVTSRYHLARCLLLAQRLGFDSVPVAAEERFVPDVHCLIRMLGESGYLMWIDLGLRWARLIGHRRMQARIS